MWRLHKDTGIIFLLLEGYDVAGREVTRLDVHLRNICIFLIKLVVHICKINSYEVPHHQ